MLNPSAKGYVFRGQAQRVVAGNSLQYFPGFAADDMELIANDLTGALSRVIHPKASGRLLGEQRAA
jgi:hypothetical protein